MKKGTSILLVNDRDQIMLVLRENINGIPYPNCWDVLGGNVEENESPRQCIIREMKEELELEVDSKELHLFNTYDMSDRREHTFWKKTDLDIEKTPLHEGQCLRWFSEEEVRNTPEDKIAFGFKPIILEFFEKALFKK
jgi:8-oxo-dGTP diphosphatase